MKRRLLFVASALVLMAAPRSVYAGALRACVTATLSANQKVLVLNQLTFDDPDETHVRKVRGSIFQVFQHYAEINEPLRLVGPDTYWSRDPVWSLVFPDQNQTLVFCPYVLVTDDAEFLVLVSDNGDRTALRIYRRREHPGQPFNGPWPDHGILIRQIPIDQIRPGEQTPEFFTDHTPQWYAGGAFTFSADNRTLIFKTPWRTTISIDLASGNMKKE